MRKKHTTGTAMIGSSSLLVIFAVLTLTVFALLSVSTVRAEERLSLASAQSVQAYYAADSTAQEILTRLLAGESVDTVTEKDGIYSYSCDISDQQILVVSVHLDNNGDYTILRWQAVPRGTWSPDDTLTVWDGNTSP